jgi:hypothetical protein
MPLSGSFAGDNTYLFVNLFILYTAVSDISDFFEFLAEGILEASVDVRAMVSAALRHLTVADVNLLKAILCAGLYPQVSCHCASSWFLPCCIC